MKRKTVKLLLWIAIAYAVILLLARGVLPSDSTPSTSLTAIPLVILAIVIIRDLVNRSTSPTRTVVMSVPETRKGRQVQFLSRQIEVTVKASASYFDDVVRSRLIELLVNKASLEGDLETESVRQIMSDKNQGRNLVNNDALYKLLYSPAPEKGRARIAMIREAVDLIEAWKS